MAEYILKEMVRNKHVEDLYEVCSAACSSEEEGNDIYPPAKRVLNKYKIPFGKHRAHKVSEVEMSEADYIIIMDNWNYRSLNYRFGKRYDNKIRYLLSFSGEGSREISDPWYTGDFETAFDEISRGCEALLEQTLS
ncbi:MAG: low molecular weight phosphotyrosine protein phosphatase [Oscillospiraceae bacterium]|nr:low molecular weight phosphotyrosine protein phosphatase [Oscillospiraceae bacterium]